MRQPILDTGCLFFDTRCLVLWGKINLSYPFPHDPGGRMLENLELTTLLPASPQAVYEAWLDSRAHGQFTGGLAEIEPTPGGAFTAWDGYIQGVTLELEPYVRILQAWRTTDFPTGALDSSVEVRLEEVPEGTHLTLIHTDIPEGQSADYQEGWIDYYFKPMQEYFANQGA